MSRSSNKAGEWLIGVNVIDSVLDSNPGAISEILLSDKRLNQRLEGVLQKAERLGVLVTRMPWPQLDKRFPDQRHQGVAAHYCGRDFLDEGELADIVSESDNPFLLILDQIQDPRNFGACLRTAEAAGVDCVIIPKDGSVGLTSVARKAASGAAERLPIVQVTNLARCLRQLQKMGVWLYGADGHSKASLYDTKLSGPCGLVMGSEGKGLRRLTKEHCDELIAIPMQSQVESLNISVAAAVMLFEVVRQRSA